MVMNNLLSLVGLVTYEYVKWFDLKDDWELEEQATYRPAP